MVVNNLKLLHGIIMGGVVRISFLASHNYELDLKMKQNKQQREK